MTDLSMELPLGGFKATHGALSLAEQEIRQATWIGPYPSAEASCDQVLRTTFGFGFPAPCQSFTGGGVRILWSGRKQALLIGEDVPTALAEYAAIIDQSDGLAVFQLTGLRAAGVLARLTPLDLRLQHFEQGRTARSLLGHMTAQITAIGSGFEIMVMRSMAQTAAHEIEDAMRSVNTRASI